MMLQFHGINTTKLLLGQFIAVCTYIVALQIIFGGSFDLVYNGHVAVDDVKTFDGSCSNGGNAIDYVTTLPSTFCLVEHGIKIYCTLIYLETLGSSVCKRFLYSDACTEYICTPETFPSA